MHVANVFTDVRRRHLNTADLARFFRGLAIHLLFVPLGVGVDVFPKILAGGEALPASGFRAHEVQLIQSLGVIGVDVKTQLWRRRQYLSAMRARMTTVFIRMRGGDVMTHDRLMDELLVTSAFFGARTWEHFLGMML